MCSNASTTQHACHTCDSDVENQNLIAEPCHFTSHYSSQSSYADDHTFDHSKDHANHWNGCRVVNNFSCRRCSNHRHEFFRDVSTKEHWKCDSWNVKTGRSVEDSSHTVDFKHQKFLDLLHFTFSRNVFQFFLGVVTECLHWDNQDFCTVQNVHSRHQCTIVEYFCIEKPCLRYREWVVDSHSSVVCVGRTNWCTNWQNLCSNSWTVRRVFCTRRCTWGVNQNRSQLHDTNGTNFFRTAHLFECWNKLDSVELVPYWFIWNLVKNFV